jgi:hypothetical protein
MALILAWLRDSFIAKSHYPQLVTSQFVYLNFYYLICLSSEANFVFKKSSDVDYH